MYTLRGCHQTIFGASNVIVTLSTCVYCPAHPHPLFCINIKTNMKKGSRSISNLFSDKLLNKSDLCKCSPPPRDSDKQGSLLVRKPYPSQREEGSGHTATTELSPRNAIIEYSG